MESSHTPVEQLPSLPKSYRKYLDGAHVPAHQGKSLRDPPEWLDREKFARGQEFSKKFFLPMILGHFIPHVFLFSWRPAFRVFVHLRKTNSVEVQWDRNLRMYRYVSSWYEGDFWDSTNPAHRTMKSVQYLHERAWSRSQDRAVLDSAKVDTSVEPAVYEQCTMWHELHKDMALPENKNSLPPLVSPSDSPVFSQMDSAVSILATLAPILVNSNKMGIHNGSKEDYEGLVHLWRVVAYYAGIEDRFNPCVGTLDEIKAASWELIYGMFHPMLKNMTAADEYYARVSFGSFMQKTAFWYFSFNCYLLMIGRGLGVKMNHVYKAMPFYEKIVYGVIVLFTTYIMRSTVVVAILNYFFRRNLRDVKK